TGSIATRPCQAFHKATSNRVGDIHEDDRDRAGRLEHGPYGRSAVGHHDIWRERHQVGCLSAIEFGIAKAPAIVDPYIAADCPTQLLQRLQECRIARLTLLVIRGQVRKHCDAPGPIRLLRVRHERPYRRASERTEKFAPPHVLPTVRLSHPTTPQKEGPGCPGPQVRRKRYRRKAVLLFAATDLLLRAALWIVPRRSDRRRASQQKRAAHVRFGSKAAHLIRAGSGSISAIPPKADLCLSPLSGVLHHARARRAVLGAVR